MACILPRCPGVDATALQPCQNPSCGEDYEDMYRFVGRFIGLSLLHQQLLSVRLTRVLYCMIVQQQFTMAVRAPRSWRTCRLRGGCTRDVT